LDKIFNIISFLFQKNSYLNTQYVKKNVFNDADLQFGTSNIDSTEHIMDIGEVNKYKPIKSIQLYLIYN
jgi:hypothetical protein